jgi:DNA repair protein RadD
MILRPYQTDAVQAVYNHLRTRDDNPVVVVPTGGGKTPILAQICSDSVKLWKGRVLVLAPAKELIQQAADKLAAVCPDVPVGVYSAGLGKRDKRQPVIVAGIQSVYQRAAELDAFDLIIPDEAHTIPPDGDGMYRQFLAEAKIVNPNVRIVGLTATPFRMRSGCICTPDGYLNSICYEIGVRKLIVDGYLSPLTTKAGKTRTDLSQVAVRGGEYVSGDLEAAMDIPELVTAAVGEIVAATQDRRAVLIFCCGIEHGAHVVEAFKQLGIFCDFVSGDTPDRQRDATIAKFKAGATRYLANVNVLTTGFDAPNVDCIALLRPTLSPGLYYQMVGRGFRLAPDKADCLVLDFGGNVLRHGPVDMLSASAATVRGQGGEAPAKECPECNAVIAAGYTFCPTCGYAFPPPERSKHDSQASDADILSGKITITKWPVLNVNYSLHIKRGSSADDPRTMRVDYTVGPGKMFTEWVCFEHDGFARSKAEKWWQARSPDPVPNDCERACEIAYGGGLATAKEITVRKIAGDKYDRITGYVLGPKPDPIPAEDLAGEDWSPVPF